MEPQRLVMEWEKRVLYKHVAGSLVLALLALAVLYWAPGIGGPVYVEEYWFNATITGLPGRDPVYLEETYRFRVAEGEYHMLYRAWPLPVYTWETYPCCAKGAILESIECPEGMKPYIVDSGGNATLITSATAGKKRDLQERVQEAEARDEAGCYSPEPLEPGVYEIRMRWILLLVPEDGRRDQALLPLAVEGRHLDYANVSGMIRSNASELAVGLAPAPVQWASAPIPRGVRAGPVSLDQGQGLVAALSTGESRLASIYASRAVLAYRAEELMSIIGALGALAVPALAVILYYARGVEPPPGPIPGGAPPRTGEKPWQVNVLYHGQVGLATYHAVAATILSLLGRGVLRIEHGPDGPVLVIPDRAEGLDWYEDRVLRILRVLAKDGRLPVREARRLAQARRRELRRLAREIFRGENLDKLAREAHEPGGREFALLAVLFAVIAIPINLSTAMGLPLHDNNMALKTLLTNLLAAGSSISIASMPSYVLGRWRKGYLERWAAWRLYAEQARERPALSIEEAAYLVALGIDREAKEMLRGAGDLGKTVEEAVDLARDIAIAIAAASGVAAAHGGASGGGGGAGAR